MSAASRGARPTPFPQAAAAALADEGLRRTVRLAQDTIRAKRARAVAELPDWEALRDAGAAVKERTLERLDEVLVELEAAVTRRGGVVHWARDAAEANAIVVRLAREAGVDEVVKVKSLATDEIRLNDALERSGVRPVETDLAELVCQLAGERPSHLLVPAIHRNRTEIRDLFRERLDLPGLSDDPAELTAAARVHLRAAFLRARVAVSGANFAVAETGTICVVESEGNGRMCTTLPETLITVMGVEKAIPAWRDLEVFLQLLPRSATGERMNPYTSLWTGVRDGDGPRAFHLVLFDAGRTRALADPAGRPVLRCIRCSACVNVCPVYRQVGGHAYHTVYAGPIGAILEPQLRGVGGQPGSLPFASSLCGACADVCPVRIDIPALLVHERARVVAGTRQGGEGRNLRRLGRIFASRTRYERAQRLARRLQRPLVREGWVRRFPGPLADWGAARDLPAVPAETFREWWARERGAGAPGAPGGGETGDPTAAPRPSPTGARGLREPTSPGAGDARSVTLGRIRAALADLPGEAADEVPRRYRTTADGRHEALGLFVERVEDYRATVLVSVDPRAGIAEALAAHGAARIGVAPDLPCELRPRGVELVEDDGLDPATLDALDGALTTCAAACAETGSLAFDGGPGQGRRALTLVPDLHVCVVRAGQIVSTVPELVAALEPAAHDGRPIVIVSGPSATSDIELQRVEGVHGPRRLVVVVVP